MAKRKRLRTKYTSKGERRNVNKTTLRLVREGASPFVKEMNILKAWKKGQNPWITVANPDEGTNRPYIRKRANSVWGDPRRRRTV